MTCKMMTAQEAIDALLNSETRELDFTFDDMMFDNVDDMSGWHGIKIITVFDNDLLVIGYYGSGALVSTNTPFFQDIEAVKRFYVKALQKYMKNECGWNGECKKICVETTKQNN